MPKEYLIEGVNGGQYSERSIQAIVKEALHKAKVTKHASVHKLRHSFATHLRTLTKQKNKIPMKSIIETLCLLLLTACVILSCGDENENSINDNSRLLIGNWNSYEIGTEQTGFTQVITTSLTLLYESGISFSSDGTFRPRYHHNGTWTITDDNMGTYELKGTTISLLFSPGTKDEYQLDIQLVKLDGKHLWIKHSHFAEVEHHLERATN